MFFDSPLFNSPLAIIAKQKISDAQPAGTNIRQTSEFQELKSEIQKGLFAHNAAPINWSLIASQAKHILENESKDILVAAYLIVAWINLYQLKGWGEAFEFLFHLLKKYGAQLQPAEKPKACLSALDWLAAQLADLFLKIGSLNDIKPLNELRGLIIDTDNLLQQYYAQTWFARLASDFQKKITQLQQPVIAAPAQVPAVINALDNTSEPEPSNSTISNTTPNDDIVTRLFQAGTHLLLTDVYNPTAYYFRRTAMWGELRTLPVYDEDFKTHIKAPSETNRRRLKAVADEANVKNAIKELELLSGENPFWLDVQRSLWQITSGKPELLAIAIIVEEHTKILYQRFPAIVKLKFDDASDLCDEQTQTWLVSLLHSPNGMTPSAHRGLVADLQLIIDKATSARERLMAEKK